MDWYPVTVRLSRRREVVVTAERLGLSRQEVAGWCLELWDWVTEESRDGHVPSVTLRGAQDALGCPDGFLESLAAVGWASFGDDGMTVPNFDRWLGRSAKRRVQNVLRQRNGRAKK